MRTPKETKDVPRKGRIARLGSATFRYGKRKLGSDESHVSGLGVLKSGYRLAFDQFSFRDLDVDDIKEGFHGRHADGGIAEFDKMIAFTGHTEKDIEDMRQIHSASSLMYAAASFVAFILACYTVFSASNALYVFIGISIFLVSLIFAALHIRHYYYAWQLKVRALGSLKACLKGEDPREGPSS